jgi:outer membrane protein
MLRLRLLSSVAVLAAALASTSTAAAQSKIAVVNFQKALLDTDEAKKAQNDLIAEFKPQQDELEKIQRALQDDQTMLQNSQGKLSPQKEAELQANIQHNQHLSDRLAQDLQDDSNRKRDETVQRLGTRMTETVAKLRDEKGLDAIFDTAATIAYNKALDLTAEATAAYNKAYPVAAAAAAK